LFLFVGPNSPPNNASAPNARDALAAQLELSRLTLWNLYGSAATAGLPDPKVPPQQEALNLEVPTRNSEGAHTPKVPSITHNNNNNISPRSTVRTIYISYETHISSS